MSDGAMQEMPIAHPMRAAWEKYKGSEDFNNAKHWALMIAPMWQAGTSEEQTRLYEIMPLNQRARHVDGSLWASFAAGWNAAMGGTTIGNAASDIQNGA